MPTSSPPPSSPGSAQVQVPKGNCQTCNPCNQDPKSVVKNDILHGQPAATTPDPNATNPGIGQRFSNLSAIDGGTATGIDPNSRLGAYQATAGYPAGTVGDSVHNAIGTIYLGMGNTGQEAIGKVFNSDQAKSLYNDPVNSASSKCMATLEYSYWKQVQQENPSSVGGNLGSAFSPTVRDVLQQSIFSSPDPNTVPYYGIGLGLP